MTGFSPIFEVESEYRDQVVRGSWVRDDSSSTLDLESERRCVPYQAACGCWVMADWDNARIRVETPDGTREAVISRVAAQCPAMVSEAVRRIVDCDGHQNTEEKR